MAIWQVDRSIVCRDIAYLRQQARHNIKRYIDERLPEEYEKCFVGLTAITKEAWNTAQSTEDKREKIQALSLAKDSSYGNNTENNNNILFLVILNNKTLV